jgi:hypothetical protein
VAAEGAGDIDDPHAEMRRTDFVGDRDINYDRTTVLDDITRCYGRRRAPASLQEVRHPAGSRHSRRGVLVVGGPEVDNKGRSWWGGPGGCVTRHLLPWREAESAPRRLVPERSSSTLAGQDHRRIVPSGLNEPQFPVFSRKT